MTSYWDTSAVVPLLVSERTSRRATELLAADPVIFTWWGTVVECASAIARRERDGSIRPDKARAAFDRLDALAKAWHEVEAGDRVRRVAMRLLRGQPLRAADALQLGAAIAAAEDDPSSMPFVTLDSRLGDVASREGFRIEWPDTT